jgi:hypothetical protein
VELLFVETSGTTAQPSLANHPTIAMVENDNDKDKDNNGGKEHGNGQGKS